MLIHSVFSEFFELRDACHSYLRLTFIVYFFCREREKESDATRRVTALFGFCLITATWVLFFAEVHSRCSVVVVRGSTGDGHGGTIAPIHIFRLKDLQR